MIHNLTSFLIYLLTFSKGRMITTTYEIIKPIIIPMILTCALLRYQIIQAIIATKYRHIFPVEICIVSGLLALAK